MVRRSGSRSAEAGLASPTSSLTWHVLAQLQPGALQQAELPHVGVVAAVLALAPKYEHPAILLLCANSKLLVPLMGQWLNNSGTDRQQLWQALLAQLHNQGGLQPSSSHSQVAKPQVRAVYWPLQAYHAKLHTCGWLVRAAGRIHRRSVEGHGVEEASRRSSTCTAET